MRPVLVVVFALVALLGGACGGNTRPAVATQETPALRWPDTTPGRLAAEWVAAISDPDPAAFRTYIETRRPEKVSELEQLMQFRAMTGGFELRAVEASSDERVVALVQERSSDQFARMTLEVDGAGKISKLELMAIPRPPGHELPAMSDAELVTAVREKLDAETTADRFSGAVRLVRHGVAVIDEVRGYADRSTSIPVSSATRFRIGSMNKMFTATAILQLVQAGKVKLDAPVGTYLTGYPSAEVASKVTIHHLLTHTGGTGDIFTPEYAEKRLTLKTLADYQALYGARALEFEPATQWAYSNYGFVLLGLVIEAVSGQDYYAYVRDHIYTPAKMTSSDSEPEEVTVADRSIGYTQAGGGTWQSNRDTLPWRGTSAGGGYSTVEDLLRFADALMGGVLVDAEHLALLTTAKPGTPEDSYAYGFAVKTVGGTRCFGHGGGAPGMNGELTICPDLGVVIAVLANLDPPAASRIAEFIENRVAAK